MKIKYIPYFKDNRMKNKDKSYFKWDKKTTVIHFPLIVNHMQLSIYIKYIILIIIQATC